MNTNAQANRLLVPVVIALLSLPAWARPMQSGGEPLAQGWIALSPREELRPRFRFEPAGGPKRTGAFVIEHDAREGLDGWIQKEFPVSGGAWYRFRAVRKLARVGLPRRSALVRIVWPGKSGGVLSADVSADRAPGLPIPTAEPEHPTDSAALSNGWTEVHGIYRAPPDATRAIVELHLQWAPKGRVEWSDIVFEECAAPPRRVVRLAAVHYRPSGKSPRQNCEEYAPLLAEAARQRADLVVLGETVPTANTGLKPHETAEPVPGRTTEYFAELARQLKLHLVLSLYERERHLVYNTAVLIGPEGTLIGKYRKTCLPHAETENGVAPGDVYPVFETSLGKIGLMVCYDGFFPEVARELSKGGAEVIAWPVWGCDPLLARARACENRVYVVSSTFMEPRQGWMLSAVYDRLGNPVAKAEDWGTVVVAEADLGQPLVGPYNLGDFRSMIPRHSPPAKER